MRQLIIILGLAIVISGCATGAKITNVTSVKAYDKSIPGVDVYAKRRARGEKVPAFRGDQLLIVRAWAEDESIAGDKPRGDEIIGAKCKVTGTEYTGKLTTPAKIRVPVYGYESTEISVECTHPKYTKSVETVRSFNQTKQARLNAGASGGLIGVLAMAVVNEASDEKNDHFLYPQVNVVMSKPKKKRKVQN